MTKSYGSTFLKSIPNCKKAYEDADVLFKMIKEFYLKTEVRKK
jgi:hypothetical protein